MILCNEDCIPCCDFCIHCIHEMVEWNGQMVDAEPIGCSLHKDQEHQWKAEACGYCDDYHCFNA